MRLLVRKIQKSKWMQNDILNGEPVSGDAITNCLKTKNNTISTWGIMSEDKIEQAVLAIVSAHQHIDTIDVVILEKENIEKKFNLKNEPGNTPVKDLVDTHIDICGINYNSLGELAQAIVDKFKENNIEAYGIDDIATYHLVKDNEFSKYLLSLFYRQPIDLHILVNEGGDILEEVSESCGLVPISSASQVEEGILVCFIPKTSYSVRLISDYKKA
ncbi:MAG TPA: hypothetical protein ENG40_01495, partial [Thermoprotei archaeon]|nr:hypothetical protein [Thermoprotei archaeon]